MARASSETVLSLDRYAMIMGMNPAHFNGCESATLFSNQRGNCNQLWYQYDWQDYDRVSRDQLARAIANAERDIASVLGYWPGPRWFEYEVVSFPRHHRPDVIDGGSYDVRGYRKGIKLPHGKIWGVGQRRIVNLGAFPIVYSDGDTDTIDELATVSLTLSAANMALLQALDGGAASSNLELGRSAAGFSSTQNIARWLHVYQEPSPLLLPEEEIRHPRVPHAYVASTGVTTLQFWSWQMLQSGTAGYGALPSINQEIVFRLEDAGTPAAGWLDEVQVTIEYPDYTIAQARLLWEPDYNCSLCNGSGCTECSYTEQDACVTVRDAELGIIAVTPATYTDGAWQKATQTVRRAPDRIMVWYWAGAISPQYIAGTTIDPLPDDMANAIAWMATARLERPLCGCGNHVALSEHLMKDLSMGSPDAFVIAANDVLSNPFGQKRGEVMAWRLVKRMTKAIPEVAVI